MVVASRVDFRYLRLVSLPMYLIALGLLVVVLLPPMGPFRPNVVGGSARWLEVGPLPAMHPAEFAKLALVVYTAHFLARKGGQSASLVHGMLPFLVIAGPVIALVATEPDLGTTGVLTLSAFTMLYVAGARVWQLALLLPVGLVGVAWYVTKNAYQMARVVTFLDPWKDPAGTGFHTVQGLLALGQGGILGTGLGQSRQAGALYLPNAQNDYIFGVVGQELGLVGGVVVIGLYLFLAYRGMRVALGAPDTFGALLATGITAWLTFQAFINIGVVTSLLPITGITLPFVSLGGSSLLVSFAAVGILLSISRETRPRGTWNDADPDRGRRHRWAHLPGAGRHPRDPEPPGGR
jgi:cell division protein FtsW